MPGKEPELSTPALTARLRALRKSQEHTERLEAQLRGYGAGLDGNSVLLVRLQILIDTLFPPGTPEGDAARLDMDFKFQESIQAFLEQAKSQVTQVRLAAGSQVPQEWIPKAFQRSMGTDGTGKLFRGK